MANEEETTTLEKLGDEFGFTHFMVIGVVDGDNGVEIHTVISPNLSPLLGIQLCTEAVNVMIEDIQNEEIMVH